MRDGCCWLSPTHDAAYFLSQQWPLQPPVQITKAEWSELEAQPKAAFASMPHEQIWQEMMEQAARLAVLRAALNMN